MTEPRSLSEVTYERALRQIARTTRDEAARAIADLALADVAKGQREAGKPQCNASDGCLTPDYCFGAGYCTGGE